MKILKADTIQTLDIEFSCQAIFVMIKVNPQLIFCRFVIASIDSLLRVREGESDQVYFVPHQFHC